MGRKKEFMSQEDKAKTKVLARRKGFLFQEHKLKNKDNVFLDRRIGEKRFQNTMSQEDKAMAKFAAERVKAHKKQSIFNLNDEEVLTHRGQSLNEIEKFENPGSDDEDYFSDDNKTGKLDKNFVSDMHFGGGLLSKSDKEVSRKTLIEQIISESKVQKAEKRKIREQTIDLTKKLDADWIDLLPIVTSANKSLPKEENQSKADDYDVAVAQLKYNARAKPSDKLKSEEEIQREEEKNFEKLENERLMRMNGFNESGQKHRSADDLEDYFQIEKIEAESEDENDKEEQEEVSDDNDNEEEEDKDEEEDEDEEEKEEVEDEEEKEEVEDDESSYSGYSDFDEDISESSSSEEEEEKPKKQSKVKISKIESNKENQESKKNVDKEMTKLEQARKELPQTFAVPETYEDLQTLFKDRNPVYQSIIIERIIKCNHWKSTENNKEKLLKLFTFLMQYTNECAAIRTDEGLIKLFETVDRLCPHLYDLVQANPADTKAHLKEIIVEKHENYENKLTKYPNFDTLILFKLMSVLYPTSDFRHPIVTPCLVYMSQILFNCRVKHKSDIAKGLFVATMILEYTTLSKRFDPSVIQFLRWVLFISFPTITKDIKSFPFKTADEACNILLLEETHEGDTFDVSKANMKVTDLVGKKIDDDFRIRAFTTAVKLLLEFKQNLENTQAAFSIFGPILKYLKNSFLNTYPKSVKIKAIELRKSIKELKEKKLEYLTFMKKKPKSLRMYEPRIEEVYTGHKRRVMSKEKLEREKLISKLKKETKGAIREIRRDSAFLSRVQIKEQIVRDTERKRKVKELFGEAASQQAELKKFKKKR